MDEVHRKKDMKYLLSRQKKEKGQKSFVAQYLCKKCNFFFEFNPSLRNSVRCPICRGTVCEAKSPAVHVTRKQEVSGRGIKQHRIRLRNVKLMRQLSECRTLFLALLRSLGVSEESVRKVSIAMDEAMRDARDEAQKRLSEF